jgi:hypothetical protein
MLGRLLTHDDQKPDEELAGAFEKTAGKWAETHATPYVWRANHADHRYYAFCGSCSPSSRIKFAILMRAIGFLGRRASRVDECVEV